MKILVDENIPVTAGTKLRGQGYDVIDIRGTSEQGMDDQQLWKKAVREQRLLITTGKGFAEHREERPPWPFDHSSQTTFLEQKPSTCFAGPAALCGQSMAGVDGRYA